MESVAVDSWLHGSGRAPLKGLSLLHSPLSFSKNYWKTMITILLSFVLIRRLGLFEGSSLPYIGPIMGLREGSP